MLTPHRVLVASLAGDLTIFVQEEGRVIVALGCVKSIQVHLQGSWDCFLGFFLELELREHIKTISRRFYINIGKKQTIDIRHKS